VTLGLLALLPRLARGDGEPAARGRDVAAVFFIAKSENRNQVHYGVHLDAACAPAGPAPVFAYWRMLEKGPFATEPLLAHETRAYGVADQHVSVRAASGGRVSMTLHALPARSIEVASARAGETCTASATTQIGGTPALLTSVYAKLAWPFGVDYLLLSGRSLANGGPVQERLRP
jgi:hypothetical protein